MKKTLRSAALCSIVLLTSHADAQATPTKAAQPTPAPVVNKSEELNLAVGENRTIAAHDVKSYSEGVPGIAEVKVTPNGSQFVVVGQKPGSTTLLMIKNNGQEVTWNISVFARPIAIVEAELAQLLGDTTGVRIRRVGSRFFIEGGVSTEAEQGRIAHIASLYPGQVESLVVLGGAAADRKINIRVDLFFVQYNKNKTYQVGIGWPSMIGGQAVVQSAFAYDFLAGVTRAATASVVNQPLPWLDLAARNGWAKVLKHATVITANGSTAEFSNGGAQNFSVANGLTSSIQQIDFGTTVKILPRFDPKSSEMQVEVNADVADLTPPVSSATNLPGQNTSKLTTAVALKLGESIVLSGIRTEARRYNTSGIPGLSEIPIIGALFGSVGDEREEVEGAVFIVPSVIESTRPRVSELIDRTLKQYGKFDGDMKDVAPFDERPAVREGGR
jgi:pilus assembly protein CpaC